MELRPESPAASTHSVSRSSTPAGTDVPAPSTVGTAHVGHTASPNTEAAPPAGGYRTGSTADQLAAKAKAKAKEAKALRPHHLWDGVRGVVSQLDQINNAAASNSNVTGYK
jgi:hypothetical protein